MEIFSIFDAYYWIAFHISGPGPGPYLVLISAWIARPPHCRLIVTLWGLDIHRGFCEDQPVQQVSCTNLTASHSCRATACFALGRRHLEQGMGFPPLGTGPGCLVCRSYSKKSKWLLFLDERMNTCWWTCWDILATAQCAFSYPVWPTGSWRVNLWFHICRF